MHCTVIGPNLHTSKIVTAISVSERLLEMAAFYIPIYAAEGDSVMKLLTSGSSGNATTALAYILLGTFATAIATTGLADIVSKKLSKIIGTKKLVLLGMITLIACLSQNLIPIHIAYIPILIPPMLVLMNKMRLDRRAVACCLAFGHKAPYIRFPLHGRRALHDELFAVPCGTAPAGTGRRVRGAHIACAAAVPTAANASTSHWIGSMPIERMVEMTWSSYSPNGQRMSVGRTPVNASILSLQVFTSAMIWSAVREL